MRRKLLLTGLFGFISCMLAAALGAAEGRTKTRLLYGFEKPEEAAALQRLAEGAEFTAVADYGVTEGKACARVVMQKGRDYDVFHLGPEAIKGWGDFDFVAIDLFTEDDHPYHFILELWDGDSKNYATRCTFEDVTTHKGKQTLLYRINRARRNGKGGLDWEQLEEKDKIQLNALSRVKLFIEPRADRNAIFWIDQIRLLQEDAAKPKLEIPLPPGALAFDFGAPGAIVPGFQNVSANNADNPPGGKDAPFELIGAKGLVNGGEGWPDLLTGTFVTAAETEQLNFRVPVPNGTYLVLLNAGKLIRPDLKSRRYRLQLNDTVIMDDFPNAAEFSSEKYLYRFLWTQYSERPHAIWEQYINVMYPGTVHEVSVTEGQFQLTASNHFVGGVILLPAGRKMEFDAMVAKIKENRIAAFEQTLFPVTHTRPRRSAGDKEFTIFFPDPGQKIEPWTGPTAAQRSWTRLSASGAPGQNVILKIAVTPFADLGKCRLVLEDLSGPGTIAKELIRGHFQNYRSNGSSVSEMVLLPSLEPTIEDRITHCFHLWLPVPANAKPGQYRATFQFETEAGRRMPVPVDFTIRPIKLESALPVSFGMYYKLPENPAFPRGADQERLIKEQLAWMREIGFTAVTVGSAQVTGMERDGTPAIRVDPLLYRLAAEVGMGARPEQKLMAQALPIGRGVGRQLNGLDGPQIDRNPGSELQLPGFEKAFLDAVQKYADFVKRMKVPVAVEIVDEPRETPNPWNRNLSDTIRYGELLHRVPGITTFVTPMADKQDNLDYTTLVDATDIVSVHAWPASAGFIKKTHQQKKTLWLYNTGMDRLSWGFYNWRIGSSGRWEWHFCWPEDQAIGGYPGRDWYNPFTSMHGFAPQAPLTYPGGMLYQSQFLDVAEGITDYAYLITLEEALRVNKAAATHSKEVLQGQVLLEEIRKTVPEYPTLHGLQQPTDGALVGTGLQDAVITRTPAWRDKIGEILEVLQDGAATKK